jgi:hypothetical protein
MDEGEVVTRRGQTGRDERSKWSALDFPIPLRLRLTSMVSWPLHSRSAGCRIALHDLPFCTFRRMAEANSC